MTTITIQDHKFNRESLKEAAVNNSSLWASVKAKSTLILMKFLKNEFADEYKNAEEVLLFNYQTNRITLEEFYLARWIIAFDLMEKQCGGLY